MIPLESSRRQRNLDWIFFGVLLPACLVLAWFNNFNERKLRGPREIYSDKAAYYVYLPATFIYGWDVHKFPKGIDEETRGFTLHYKNDKLIIKTTCAEAILIAPFFLVTHLVAVIWDLQPDGFSDIYQKMAIFPAVVYLVLGLFFLKRFLDHYFRGWIPYLAVILVFAGTNLYFFSIDEGLMSHVYSFFLFSLFLFLVKKYFSGEKRSYLLFILIAFVFGFAVLLRPTNVLILSWMVFLDVGTWREAGRRILLLLKPIHILTLLAAGFLVFLPQLFYWKYLSGSFMYYSYPGESFLNWKNPRIIALWFAPLNGLFLYSPLVLAFIAGIAMMIRRKVPNGIFTGVFFLLISYVFASWHSWFFGGSYGYRPFVEYYALFSLPFAFLLGSIPKMRNLFVRSCVVLFIFFSTYYSLSMIYNYRWNTSSTWAWDDFLKHAEIARVYRWPGERYTYIEDFENPALATIYPQRECVHSPTLGGFVDKRTLFSDKFSRCLGTILKKPVSRVEASLWYNPGPGRETGAQFVCTVEDWQHNSFYYRFLKFDDFKGEPYHWTRVSGTFTIPEWIDQTQIISFFVWDFEEKDSIYIDDIRLKFK
jgi:hypothetical protein